MYNRLTEIKNSYSVSFADFVRKKERSGIKVIKLQTGEPHFGTHEKIIRSASKSMITGNTKYCDSRGIINLRESLVKKLNIKNKINNINVDNIIITHGAVHAINMAIRCFINKGDECIVIEPYWRAYEENVKLSDGVCKIIPHNNQFSLDVDKIKKTITNKTKLIIINTPNNPSGAVYKKSDLIKLLKLSTEKNIRIISDEVYESILYDGTQHFSMASLDEYFDNIISVFSFSKTYSMTGWRIGYLVANEKIINQILKISQFSITNISHYNQLGAITALNDNVVKKDILERSIEYQKNLDLIRRKIINTWLEDKIFIPSGAFYVLINMKEFNIKSIDLVHIILDEYNISFTPGIAFGDNMDYYIRMCFATSKKNILTAIESLFKFKKKYG